MSVKRIEPEEAQQLLESSEGYVYLDVRSPEEFAAGHVPGAINIPIMVRHPGGPGMVPNEHFIDQVESRLATDAKIIVGCLRGGRSLRAAQMMTACGFENVVDMRGGYDGELDPSGTVVFPGWARRGLPTTTG